MCRFFSKTIYSLSFELNKLRAHAGVFFGLVNLATAFGSDLDEPFWNYFSCLFSLIAILSIIVIPLLRSNQEMEGLGTIRLIETTEEENDSARAKLTLYEKILYSTAGMGTFVAPFNVARFNPVFLSLIRERSTSKIIYIVCNSIMSLFSISAEFIQKRIKSDSVLLSAFIETCMKSTAWVCMVFAMILTQFIVFEENKINITEVNVLSGILAGLFITDFSLFYSTISVKGSRNAAKIFFELSLNANNSIYEKFLWRTNFILDIFRELINVLGNVMAIPNIISISSSFNKITHGKIRKYVYLGLTLFGAGCGVNNALVVTQKRLYEDVPVENFSVNQV